MNEPVAFASLESPANKGWQVGSEIYFENPKIWLDPSYINIVRLWASCQPGGMGQPFLPMAGGMLDQLAFLMDAFVIVAAAMREWQKEHKDV